MFAPKKFLSFQLCKQDQETQFCLTSVLFWRKYEKSVASAHWCFIEFLYNPRQIVQQCELYSFKARNSIKYNERTKKQSKSLPQKLFECRKFLFDFSIKIMFSNSFRLSIWSRFWYKFKTFYRKFENLLFFIELLYNSLELIQQYGFYRSKVGNNSAQNNKKPQKFRLSEIFVLFQI